MVTRITLLAICIAISVGLGHGQEVTLTITPNMITPTNSATLKCQVDNYQAGNMIIWYKRQADGSPDVIGFNNAISNPNYEGKFTTKPPENIGNAFVVELVLNSADLNDAGEYGCGLTPEAIIYQKLSIIMPIRELKMFALRGNETDTDKVMEIKPGHNFEVIVGETYYVRCLAFGSNPPATMKMMLNDDDITDRFIRKEIAFQDDDLISPFGALSFEQFNTTLTSVQPLTVKEEYNRRHLICTASVPEHDPLSIFIRPVFRAPPILKCEDARELPAWTKDVKLTCRGEADPELVDAVWYWSSVGNSHNETIGIGDKNDKMEARYSVEEATGDYVIELHIKQLSLNMFRRYNLRVFNELGEAVGYVEIKRDITGEEINSSNTRIASLALVILSLLVAFQKL